MADQLDVNEMRRKIAAAAEEERKLLSPAAGAGDQESEQPVSDDLVHDCLDLNERGDGRLFAALHRGKFVNVSNWDRAGRWLVWTGHHWEIDRTGRAIDAVEDVAIRYLYLSDCQNGEKRALEKRVFELNALIEGDPTPSADFLDERLAKNIQLAKINQMQKRCIDRASRLRSKKGAENCLYWATNIGDESLTILGDIIDTKPWLLPCGNGVIDLKTGELLPGKPGDYLLRAVPVEWRGISEPCPNFTTFFNEIHLGNTAVIDFLYRLFGYSITGLKKNHFIGVFLGEGRNGKGTLFELFRWLLGDLAWNISPEMLLEQKVSSSSAGPRADIMSLHGKRFVISSESDENRRISLAAVKLYTGGDTIPARGPFDHDVTNITPTWKMFFYTNHIPRGLTADFAIRQRLIYIKYPLKFVDQPDPADPLQRPRDPDLFDRLQAEASGILAALVRGCLDWQRLGGFKPPESIMASVEELRKQEDVFLQFVSDSGEIEIDPEAKVSFKDLYNKFSDWYRDEKSDSDKYRPTKMAISAWLEKRGYERRKPSGIATVYGMRLSPLGGNL